MKKLLGLSLILIGLCVVGSLGAATAPGVVDTLAPAAEELPRVALPWDLAFTDPAASACPAAGFDLGDLITTGSCVPENQVCRSPYFTGECCPGLHCTYLYPNVPWYCL